MSARDFAVKVGEAEVPCRLPLMPTRMQILSVYSSVGRARSKDRAQFVRINALYAALAACMATPPECGTLTAWQGDVVAYGEAAADELCEGDPARLTALVEAGRECFERIVDSIPTKDELEVAKRPTKAPAETSTGATSESV